MSFEGRAVQPPLHRGHKLRINRLGADAVPALQTGVVDQGVLLLLKSGLFPLAFQSPFGLLPRQGKENKQYCTTIGAAWRTGSRRRSYTDLEELNKRLFSINISLLTELADILCSVH